MTREEIFGIMGKYYGNAYFGHYDEKTYTGPPIGERELVILRDILDEFNSLGYHISNLHKVSEIEDIRFVKVIVDNVNRYGQDGPMRELVYALNRLSYHEATPEVLRWHQDPGFQENQLHWLISSAAYGIRNKRYMSQYMEIIRKSEYGKELDMVIDIPLTFRNREALDLLLGMQEKYGIWGWWVTKYVPRFKDPSLIQELEKLLEHPDPEIRSRARKGIDKLQA